MEIYYKYYCEDYKNEKFFSVSSVDDIEKLIKKAGSALLFKALDHEIIEGPFIEGNVKKIIKNDGQVQFFAIGDWGFQIPTKVSYYKTITVTPLSKRAKNFLKEIKIKRLIEKYNIEENLAKGLVTVPWGFQPEVQNMAQELQKIVPFLEPYNGNLSRKNWEYWSGQKSELSMPRTLAATIAAERACGLQVKQPDFC